MRFEKVGFIGLGIMGKPMAKNLLKAGYSLVVHNRSRDSVKELVSMGAEEAFSPSEVARKTQVFITMLPNSPDVELVALDRDGLIDGAKEGSYYIDMSSISPVIARKVAERMKEKGVHMLDAPVSGGEKGAIEGNLAIMVGGESKDFEVVRPILDVLGSKVTHVGGIGSGNTVKLVNQIIVALNIVSFSEAFALGAASGVAPQTIFDAIKEGLAGSKVLEFRMPKVLDGDFSPGFKLSLHYKDIKNAMDAAESLEIPLPFTSIVKEVMKQLVHAGDGNLDHSAIIRFYERLTGKEVRRENGS